MTGRFGQSQDEGTGLCPATPSDCSSDLVIHSDTLKLVKTSCDGKVACDAFTITEITTILCDGFAVIPDYGYFDYECVTAPPSE